MSELEVHPDPEAIASVVADRLVRAAADGGHVIVTGGSSPRRAYELAAERAGRHADWSGATLWFSDERAVPPDHPDSNYRMAAQALLDHLPDGRGPRVHRMEGELGAEAGADRYEALLRAELGDAPAFALAILGMGPDGHVASLFPGKPEVEEAVRLAVAVPEAGLEPFVARISLTLPALGAARETLFLVTGEGKAQSAARAFGPDPDPGLPASRVDALVLLDEAAAARL